MDIAAWIEKGISFAFAMILLLWVLRKQDTRSEKLEVKIDAKFDKMTDAMLCLIKKFDRFLWATYIKAAGQNNPNAEELRRIAMEEDEKEPVPCPPKEKAKIT